MYYHYTTLETFFRILQGVKEVNGELCLHLHATNINKVNDPTEMFLEQDSLYSLVDNYEKNNNIDPSLRVADYIKALDSEDYKKILKQEKGEHAPYIVCFSNMGDYLPMWSLYGDKDKGVCLCFSEDFIKKRNVDSPLLSVDVEYNNYQNSQMVELSLSLFYKGLSYNDMEKFSKDTISELLLEISPFIKNNSYEYENEFRITIYNYQRKNDNGDVSTFYDNSKDYIEIPIPLKYLQSLIIGSKLPFEITKKLLGDYFKKNCYNIDICQSTIPFR